MQTQLLCLAFAAVFPVGAIPTLLGCPSIHQTCVPGPECASRHSAHAGITRLAKPCGFLGRGQGHVCCDPVRIDVDQPTWQTSGRSPTLLGCPSVQQTCVPGPECASRHSAHAGISGWLATPCGFLGRGRGHVCCDPVRIDVDQPTWQTSGLPLDAGLTLLPSACGNPNRTLKSLPSGGDHEDAAAGASIGGFNAVPGKWPWMALFGRLDSDSGFGPMLGGWFCGGTLISPLHVLTAAHCLRPEQAGTVGVRIGDHNLSTGREVHHQDMRVSRIIRHPHFGGAQNDIALVVLSEPVKLTQAVRPICLPPVDAEHRDADVDMAGWGRLEFTGETPDVLQEVPLTVVNEAACERAYSVLPSFDRRFPGGFQGTKICAASRDGEPRDACPGDSGGPLMAARPDRLYELVGVVSTGVGCGNREFPGVYTKVSRYIGWILDNLN